MALIGVNPIQQKPQEKEEDLLTKIAKGVQLATSVLQGVGAVQDIGTKKQLNKTAELQGLKAQADLDTIKNEQAGKFTPASYAQSKLVPAEANDPNAFPVTILLPDGQSKLIPSKPQGDLEALFKQTSVMKNLQDLKDAPLKTESEKLTIDQKKLNLETPSEFQSKSALFAKKMEQAESALLGLYDKGYDPTTFKESSKRLLMGPLEGFKGEDLKKQEQAERSFINAVLRDESGAAIPDKELANYAMQYFPRINDTPEVLEQKKQNRLLAIEGMRVQAGKAYDKIQTPKGNDSKQPGSSPGIDAASIEAELKRRGIIK